MDNDAKTVKPVSGTAEIDVNDLKNTSKFEARLIPEGARACDSAHFFGMEILRYELRVHGLGG